MAEWFSVRLCDISSLSLLVVWFVRKWESVSTWKETGFLELICDRIEFEQSYIVVVWLCLCVRRKRAFLCACSALNNASQYTANTHKTKRTSSVSTFIIGSYKLIFCLMLLDFLRHVHRFSCEYIQLGIMEMMMMGMRLYYRQPKHFVWHWFRIRSRLSYLHCLVGLSYYLCERQPHWGRTHAVWAISAYWYWADALSDEGNNGGRGDGIVGFGNDLWKQRN